MNRILKVRLAGYDPVTKAKVKEVETTKGKFLTRVSAYNQVIERIETKIKAQTGKTLIGPPIKMFSFKYANKYKPRQSKLYIKQLTNSRLTRDKFYDVDILHDEVKLYNQKLKDADRVVLFNPQISDNDWAIYNDDDVTSIIITQVLAKIPHITIPINPDSDAQKVIDMLGWVRRNMTYWQNYFLLINPHMNISEIEKLMLYSVNDKFFMGGIMPGKTPSQFVNLRAYRTMAKLIPDDKLLMAVDVPDRFGATGLPTQMALRCLNFDITCKNVKLDMPPQAFNEGYKKKIYERFIYVDDVAGLLNDTEQMKWTGKSTTQLLTEVYSLKEGIDYTELATAFNFVALNKTGAVEAEHIIQKTHKKYIEQRPLLETFISSIVEVA